jgi:hypothetical protein
MTNLEAAPISQAGNMALKKVFSRLKSVISARTGSTRELEGLPRVDDGNPQSDRAAARKDAHRLAEQIEKDEPDYCWDFKEIEKFPATQLLLAASPEVQIEFIRRCFEKMATLREKLGSPEGKEVYYFNLGHQKEYPKAVAVATRRLLRKKLPFTEDDLLFMVDRLAHLECVSIFALNPIENLVGTLERCLVGRTPGKELREALDRLQQALDFISNAPEQKLRRRIITLMETAGPNSQDLPRVMLQPGEAWSDAAIADLKKTEGDQRAAWMHLLNHCQKASGGSPSSGWLKTAREFVKQGGVQEFRRRVLNWFPLVNLPRSRPVEHGHPDPNQLIIEPHSDLLKGLVWACSLKEDAEIARALTALAISAYRKIPQKGPREVKVGNACVYTLGAMPGMEGVGQLALLKVRVKFGTAQKMIEKALEATATRVGLPREELEEMAVPAYGLSEVGRCAEKIGDFTAELKITGTDSTATEWIRADGKRQNSVPAIVKEKFAEEFAELRSAAKDIQRMLPAQRERIDNLFREQKTWPFSVWRERYLDHPLVGVLARRLIWEVLNGKDTVPAIFFDGELVDVDLKPLTTLGQNTTVQLWHPIGKDSEEIVAWRQWLENQQIQQPFKQAHREVYLLTEAERRTGTYSNRFAAHVLKQHQFNALCAARGWKNKLRLLVDAEYPPAALFLPKWNLRAEFWIEGLGDDYGSDTNESGVFLYVSTDQLRFYRLDAAQRTAHAGGGGYHAGYQETNSEPLPLSEIPPLVFSEVLRDVDLFVGVASVANDPTWSDGGPEGRYRGYWQSHSFGDLSASAKTRKEVLQNLVPKLKIADKCSFEEKFLVIRGGLRSYKIHLGSSNILMSPNDQYLCIVPNQAAAAGGTADVFLPFEGDRTLSVILSKAFLLAEDTKIKDETILRQIRPG